MLGVADDEQLPVRQARAGDSGAWDALLHRYQLPLYAYTFELVRDEQASLDLVQETFIAAFRHLATLRDDARFGSWLFGIAHQKCLQLWRQRDRATAIRAELADQPADYAADPRELLLRAEQEAEFLQLLQQLSLQQRSVLLLHYLEDFSLEEIARITDTQLGTVKSRMHYAKHALRKLLEEQIP